MSETCASDSLARGCRDSLYLIVIKVYPGISLLAGKGLVCSAYPCADCNGLSFLGFTPPRSTVGAWRSVVLITYLVTVVTTHLYLGCL